MEEISKVKELVAEGLQDLRNLEYSEDLQLVKEMYETYNAEYKHHDALRKETVKAWMAETKKLYQVRTGLKSVHDGIKSKRKAELASVFAAIEDKHEDPLEAQLEKQGYDLESDFSFKVAFGDDADIDRVVAILKHHNLLGIIEKLCEKACASKQENIFEGVKGVDVWQG